MTWSQQKIEDLSLWIMDVNDPDFDNTWNEVQWAFWRSYTPQIILRADSDNTDPIYIAEHASSWIDEMYPIKPWDSFIVNRSYIKAMNIFYVNWLTWNFLYVVVR